MAYHYINQRTTRQRKSKNAQKRIDRVMPGEETSRTAAAETTIGLQQSITSTNKKRSNQSALREFRPFMHCTADDVRVTVDGTYGSPIGADIKKFFFSQRAVNGWNRLPATVVNAESINAFKNAYDRNYVSDMDDRSR